MAHFYFTQRRYNNFIDFFDEESNRNKVIRPKDIGPIYEGEEKDFAHTVVIDKEGKDYWRFKNSWGRDWANGGYAKIHKESIKIQCYWIEIMEDELAEEEKQK